MRVPTPPPAHVVEPVEDARAFRFSNGRVARSLAELAAALHEVPAGTAYYHREHLVPWLRDVMGDEPLARRFEHYAREGGEPDAFRDLLADLAANRVEQLRGLAATRSA